VWGTRWPPNTFPGRVRPCLTPAAT
jgi:hypothetical protein